MRVPDFLGAKFPVTRAFDVPIHSSQTLLVSDSVGTTSSCSLPLLLGIHLEVVTVVDYSQQLHN